MQNIDSIDNGRSFDWGKTSADYAKYRDIYPESYFQNLESIGYGAYPQSILDIGTGTGVLPRAVYQPGLDITGIDIAANQIKAAEELSASENKAISYKVASAEHSSLPGSPGYPPSRR